jgi:small subunit ribosomal protein S3
MAIERKFIAENIKKIQVKEFLKSELKRAGCGGIDIQRTPLGTRVMIHAQKPGLVIGRKGSTIRRLTNLLKKEYEIDNPQIEVSELEIPELNAQVMAEYVATSLERGIHFRRAAYSALRKVTEAGARGVEIEVSGKLTGDRSKVVKFLSGYLKHCGDPALLYVRHGMATANPKQGVLGVKVKIMPPGVTLPDEVRILKEEELTEIIKGEMPRVVKATKEEIEVLVEGMEEELSTLKEGEAPPIKKLKPEKVKRKVQKKGVEEVDLSLEEGEAGVEEGGSKPPGETPEEKKPKKETKSPKVKAKKVEPKEKKPEEKKTKTAKGKES